MNGNKVSEMNAMSRRSMLARLLAYGTTAAVGSAALAAAPPQARGLWNFGKVLPDWEPLEIATGDTLLVSAQIGGLPIRAVLDSGSGASIMSPLLAAKLGMASGEQRTISGLSGKAPVRLARNVDVLLGRESRRLPFAVVADLSPLSSAFGRPIDLLLGADLFAGSCVALDFANSRFSITKTGSFIPGSEWIAVPLGHGAKKELFISASVAGLSPVPLMLDLGSSAALMLSSAYINAHGLTNGKLTSTAALGGVEGINTIDVFTIPELTITGLGVANIPTLGMRNWLSTSTVGNIGLPLIAQFDAVFDVTAGFVWLRALAPRRRLPMLKDRSGLGLAASADGLTVVHVATGSPAAKAGWLIGDRIVTVNGRAIDKDYTHGSLWHWRFGPAGDHVRLGLSASDIRDLQLADYY
jgi:hypothetical protein